MLPTDNRQPGLYYFAPIIGTPARIGEVDLMTLHHDGHLECSGIRAGERMHLHPDATESLWERLAGSPQTARAIASNIMAKA
jgi:hypothetical protein